MATVSEAMLWAEHEADLKAAVGPFQADDAVVQMMFDAAKDKADAYMQNPFTDADGEDLDIPPLVKVGVYALTAQLLDGLSEERRDIESIRNHAITVKYAKPGEAMQALMLRYFWPSKSLEVF